MSTWIKILRIIATVLLGLFSAICLLGMFYSNAPVLFLVLILLAAFGVFAMYYFPSDRAKMGKAERQALREATRDLQTAQAEAARLRTEAQQLRESAEADAARIRTDAAAAAAQERAAAQTWADNERSAAKAVGQRASQKLQEAESQASAAIANANDEAARIIERARKKAEEIAGEAYEAKGKADEYQKTAEAMRNVIEGYGTQYLKPSYSLLDELAEDFSFTDAGQKLKAARETSARMVRIGYAAKCDYVEANRRDTAVAFVVDAFNGKVDSILSKTKKDNYGVLEQRIRDAYQIVNNNGKAFRNTRITPEYLDARLEELKWASTVSELKAKDQEEQRRIRERMREEERARREYERAQKEAAKEEEMLRKAMVKAEAALKYAADAERAKYEERLEDLRAQLAEAEAKGQRALSMAQQTRRGNVYVISNIGAFGENVYKVGMTRRLDPLDRVRELGDASVPFPFDVHAIIESDDAPTLESQLHQELALAQMNKVNPRKEFFKVPLSTIKALIDAKGLQTTWTLKAEAAQYYETLAIEKEIQENPEMKAKWEAFAADIAHEEMSGEAEDDE